MPNPTNVDLVFKMNKANTPKKTVINANNLPKYFWFKIKYNVKGNLINKLAAITFLFPLLPVRFMIFWSRDMVSKLVVNPLMTYKASCKSTILTNNETALNTKRMSCLKQRIDKLMNIK